MAYCWPDCIISPFGKTVLHACVIRVLQKEQYKDLRVERKLHVNGCIKHHAKNFADLPLYNLGENTFLCTIFNFLHGSCQCLYEHTTEFILSQLD